MGVDTCIYCKTKDGTEPNASWLPNGVSVDTAQEWAIDGATHEIDNPWRYYGKGYERGPWPMIAGVLMMLFADPNVETVWYFGDCYGDDVPFTRERLQEMNEYYMRNGNRPYFGG